jgi:hypothetical protein
MYINSIHEYDCLRNKKVIGGHVEGGIVHTVSGLSGIGAMES